MKTSNSRMTCIILLALICGIIGVYRLGWFDLSFIARPIEARDTADAADAADVVDVEDNDTETATDVTEASDTEATETDMTDTVIETEPDTESSSTAPGEAIFISVGDAEADGYEFSYGDWENGFILADATEATEIPLPTYFSAAMETKYKVSYEMQEDKSPYKPVYTPYTADKKAVTLYMGYIIAEVGDGENVLIYSTEGKLLGSYNEKKIAPAWRRDNEDRPLFIYKDAYYYLDSKKGKFIEADYIDERDSRGANFDYTPDYGDDANGRSFNVTTELVDIYEPIENKFDAEGFQLAYKIPTEIHRYELADSRGNAILDPIKDPPYYGAYAFSGSRAAVIDADGHLYYITKSGSVAVRTGKVRRDIELGRSVFDFYMKPTTNGEESIGFYYFENGLCRVRLMSVDYYRYNKYKRLYVVSDDDFIIYGNGDRFPTPQGYDIISYSSGMILLEKDGKYGYMDYTGDWIVEPTLKYAEPFYEGVAVIGDGESFGLIGTDGEFIIPMGQYSYISHPSSGVMLVYGEDLGWRILYKMEKD